VSRGATSALEAYQKIGIVFDWQQKIGVSVSAENGALGLTLHATQNRFNGISSDMLC